MVECPLAKYPLIITPPLYSSQDVLNELLYSKSFISYVSCRIIRFMFKFFLIFKKNMENQDKKSKNKEQKKIMKKK